MQRKIARRGRVPVEYALVGASERGCGNASTIAQPARRVCLKLHTRSLVRGLTPGIGSAFGSMADRPRTRGSSHRAGCLAVAPSVQIVPRWLIAPPARPNLAAIGPRAELDAVPCASGLSRLSPVGGVGEARLMARVESAGTPRVITARPLAECWGAPVPRVRCWRALALARKTGTAFWASPGSARQALTGLALRMAISPPIETRFGAIEISLRDSQIGVYVARLVVDEVPMLPGGAVTLDTKASMADDNLVNGGDHQKGYRPKPRSP